MPDLELADVTVVIVTYESAAFVGDCLGSLPGALLGGVVVVDNESTDDTRAVVGATAPAARLLSLDRNVGFGAGCNAGLVEVVTELVLFLNPDAVLGTDDLRHLVGYMNEHPDVGLVGARVFRSGDALTSAGGLSSVASSLGSLMPPWLGRWFPDHRLPPDHAESGPVGYVEGACMLTRRRALEEVGAFDERYFLFFEEQDLSRRLRQAGYETHLDAGARVEHAVGSARASAPFAARAEYVASNRAYLRRWEGRVSAALFGWVVAASWWTRGRLGRVDRGLANAIVSAALKPT